MELYDKTSKVGMLNCWGSGNEQADGLCGDHQIMDSKESLSNRLKKSAKHTDGCLPAALLVGDSARKQNEKSSDSLLCLSRSLSPLPPGDCPFINITRSQVVTALQIVGRVQIGQWLH